MCVSRSPHHLLPYRRLLGKGRQLSIGNMERKTARLTVLVDPNKKKAFEELCAAQDVTPSQVVRKLIREYLREHDVTYNTQSGRSPDGSRRSVDEL